MSATTMPAVVNYENVADAVELREIGVPDVPDDHVLLRTAAVSVCGSDLHQWHASHSWPVNYPVVLGHEGAGVVEEVGDAVTSVAPGDHVVPLYIPECRQCRYCLSGRTNLCVTLRENQGKGLMPASASAGSASAPASSARPRRWST